MFMLFTGKRPLVKASSAVLVKIKKEQNNNKTNNDVTDTTVIFGMFFLIDCLNTKIPFLQFENVILLFKVTIVIVLRISVQFKLGLKRR
ncbi:MAG TPA: hypothetical protein PKG81_06390, partial [Candidatus Omnitrophota bacterium]|nr:hypothetical protein [Candidatus Omnitrophota bacterium]